MNLNYGKSVIGLLSIILRQGRHYSLIIVMNKYKIKYKRKQKVNKLNFLEITRILLQWFLYIRYGDEKFTL